MVGQTRQGSVKQPIVADFEPPMGPMRIVIGWSLTGAKYRMGTRVKMHCDGL
jgi:hypothetical protein